jgi:hypothetical protein
LAAQRNSRPFSELEGRPFSNFGLLAASPTVGGKSLKGRLHTTPSG